MSVRAESLRLHAAGYVSMGFDLTFDETTHKKKMKFKLNWQTARLDTCLTDMFLPDDNALAIVTGAASDVIVVDLDKAKNKDLQQGLLDAVDVFHELVEKHGLDPSVLRARTASGGMHLFFKLSSSLENGLKSAGNGSKLGGMTLDVRGDGGCIICHPSAVQGRQYMWETPIVPAQDLPAVPSWLIALLNQRSKAIQPDPPAKRQRTNDIDTSNVLAATVQRQLQKFVPPLSMGKAWPRSNGLDFKLQDSTCQCPNCHNVHISNNYTARVLIDSAWILGNYSTSCRQQVFGWDCCSIIKQLMASPQTDDSHVKVLFAIYMVQQRTIKWTAANRFLSFNGVIWEPINPYILKQDIKSIIPLVISPLIYNIPKTDDSAPKIKALASARKYIEKSHNCSSILQSYQIFAFDGELEDGLDTNPDLLAVANGVINLPTGTLVEGRSSQYISIQLSTSFHDDPTPLIDTFFDSIFNNDLDVIRYMQRLLGYGITGHTREQVWAIWTGSGSNGKSLLQDTLKALMGQLAVMMPAELLFDVGKSSAGASTPHLQTLIKKRLAFKDEGRADKANVLNEELIKTVTGSATITTRPLYKDYIEFSPSHLPILLCNQKPHVNVNDAAMMRRIIVIRFPNKYTAPGAVQDPYDETNPTHRLRDTQLQARLLSEDGQQQLLTWLVKGAAMWYKEGLGVMPSAVAEAFASYREENDHLSAFIAECCTLEPAASSNASQFLQALNNHSGHRYKQKDLQKMMAAKGFRYMTCGRQYRGVMIQGHE